MCRPSYIKENGFTDDVNGVIRKHITGGSMILMYTDRFVCCDQQDISDIDHLLEARVFNADSEIKFLRPTLSDSFSYRWIDDSQLEKDAYIEEDHYLDINSKLSSGKDYVTTGGGRYSLPVADAEKVKIRNYISYDKQGIAQISDFRVVRYLKKGEA